MSYKHYILPKYHTEIGTQAMASILSLFVTHFQGSWKRAEDKEWEYLNC